MIKLLSFGRIEPCPGQKDMVIAASVHQGVYPWRLIVSGLIIVLVTVVVSAGVGSVSIPPLTVIKILLVRLPLIDIAQTWPETWETILWDVRLPRIVLAGVVGGALSLSGATYQGLFRNPLADPFLIGVASGAGLGAIIVLVSGVPHLFVGFDLLPVAAFIGALSAVTAAYYLARDSDGLPLGSLILAGVAIAYLASSLGVMLMMQSDANLRPILSWLLGGFISTEWKHSFLVLIYLIPSGMIVFAYGRILNVLQLNEEHAKQIGVNVERSKMLLIVAATLATSAAVSVSGLIGFVGLIAPHTVRLIWGVDYRRLLPMTMIVGIAFLILADLIARTIASPTELPVGVITAFVGAPFFLYLLRRRPVGM